MKSVLAVAVAIATATACSVDGSATPIPNLADRMVATSAFPNGSATAVPAAQVPGAVADITFRPLRGENNPAQCTPPAVDVETAEVLVGPGPGVGSTLTALLVRVTDKIADYTELISSCGEFVLGGTVGTRVTSRVVSNTDGAVLTDRSLSTGAATFAHIHEMVRQQGDIRLYVQARYADAADEQDALTSTRALFTAASTAAFSAG